MYYVCIENNEVVSVLNYEPSVPSSVFVATITDEENNKLVARTHYYNVSTRRVEPISDEEANQQNVADANGVEREFLNSTDWKVLRHIRQKHLGIETTLTEAEYTELEQQREAAASRIIE